MTLTPERIPTKSRHILCFLQTAILLIAIVALPDTVTAQTEAQKEKSPKKAFFMSLLIPGWGEYYSGAKYRAAGFIGAEALTWIAWSGWRGKGADLRSDFRRFADQNWDEARYRAWQAYNASLPTGARYIETETLPTKQGDIQQYYELVGKYAQFIYGWIDVAGRPLGVDNQSVNSSVQEQYDTMRNESNKHLKRASVVIGLTVVNHVISAIHASTYTKRLASSESRRVWVGLLPFLPDGRDGVTASLSTSF